VNDRNSFMVAAMIGAVACGGEQSGVARGSTETEVPPNLDGQQMPDMSVDPGNPGIAPEPTMTTCSPSARVQPRLYRLSATQYGNALRDLLDLEQSPLVVGDTEATLLFFPREDAPVQASIAEGFSRASRDALQNVDIDALSGCGASSDTTASNPEALACARAFLEDVASRAFRRPLDSLDRDAIFAGATSPFVVGSAAGVDNGIRLALEAVLNAPSFVYRRELGTASGRLSSLETAEQLAFLLRDSIPDDELWQAGLDDQLQTDEQIEAQVDRLLLDPVVRANITRIIGAWFGADRVLQVSKDPTVFPGFNDGNLQAALFESNRRFIDDVLWTRGGRLGDLLSSPRVFLNSSLAAAYGLPFPGTNPNEFLPYDMPGERAGVLTQPALMAAFSSSLETSVVKRGLFVVRRAMCLPQPPAPTPEIFALAVAQAGDLSRTEKQKAEYRADPANPCAGCHGLIDPYGLVFENYDAIGRYRTMLLSGQAVDASATMQEQVVLSPDTFSADEDFTEVVRGAVDFAGRMGQTDQFAFCGNRQLLSYALGRDVDESCVKQDLEQGTIHRDMTISEIIHNVVLDDLTRRRDLEGGI
jgi:hypothetical protein